MKDKKEEKKKETPRCNRCGLRKSILETDEGTRWWCSNCETQLLDPKFRF